MSIAKKSGNITYSERGYSIRWELARYTDVVFIGFTKPVDEVLAMAKARRAQGEQ